MTVCNTQCQTASVTTTTCATDRPPHRAACKVGGRAHSHLAIQATKHNSSVFDRAQQYVVRAARGDGAGLARQQSRPGISVRAEAKSPRRCMRATKRNSAQSHPVDAQSFRLRKAGTRRRRQPVQLQSGKTAAWSGSPGSLLEAKAHSLLRRGGCLARAASRLRRARLPRRVRLRPVLSRLGQAQRHVCAAGG